MKKIICLILVIYCLVLAAYAAGETQHFVIKNGENVTIYKITNLGENDFGNIDTRIDVSSFKNITVADLRCSEAPEEAWKMCGAYENGFYSSEISRLTKENEELKTSYEDLKFENEKTLSQLWTAIAAGLTFGLIALILFAALFKKQKKELAK